MPTNRDSDAIGVVFRIPGDFMWSSEESISALRGGSPVTDIIEWEQGDPEIVNFVLSDISLVFYLDAALTNQISTGDVGYSIGDQDLPDIITLGSFVDNGDSTGQVEITVNPGGITETELTALRLVYVVLRVSQPDPTD